MFILASSIIIGIIILILLIYIVINEFSNEKPDAQYTFNMKKQANYKKEVNNEYTIKNIVNIDNFHSKQNHPKNETKNERYSPTIINKFENKVIVPNNTPIQIVCNNYFFSSSEKSKIQLSI